MGEEKTFLGEVALLDEIAPDDDFGAFDLLPNLALINELAAEFSDHLELMPYQEWGETVKLAVSVYLRPKSGGGRIIAVLSHEDYPSDKAGLVPVIKQAAKHLEYLIRGIGHKFVEESLTSACESLEQLIAKASAL